MNKHIQNPDLSHAIQLVRKDSTKEQMLFEALAHAKLLCPVRGNTDILQNKSSRGIRKEAPVYPVCISFPSGEEYLMAFTNNKELNKWEQGKLKHTVVCAFDIYKRLIARTGSLYRGLAINPFSDNIILEFETFSENKDRRAGADGFDTSYIGTPQEYPASMVERLKLYFRKTQLVYSAYLLWVAGKQDAGYLLLLGTKMSPQKLFPKIGTLCQPFLYNHMLDIAPLDSSFGQTAAKNQVPFYNYAEYLSDLDYLSSHSAG